MRVIPPAAADASAAMAPVARDGGPDSADGFDPGSCVSSEGREIAVIRPADFGASPAARRVARFAAGAVMLGSLGNPAGGVVEQCGRVGRALGMTDAELDLGALEGLPAAHAECQRTVARAQRELTALRAAGATVTVQPGTAVDVMSLGGYVECLHDCDPSVPLAAASVACEGEARGHCSGACTGSCEVVNEHPAACAGTCNGHCTGTCSATDSNGDCVGTCRGQCEGQCTTRGASACAGDCRGACGGEWTSEVACAGAAHPTRAVDAVCRASCDATSAIWRDHPDGDPATVVIRGGDASVAARVRSLTSELPPALSQLVALRNDLRIRLAAARALIQASAGLQPVAAALGERPARCERGVRPPLERSVTDTTALLAELDATLAAFGVTAP